MYETWVIVSLICGLAAIVFIVRVELNSRRQLRKRAEEGATPVAAEATKKR